MNYNICNRIAYVQISTANAELQGNNVNVIWWETRMFSPRALVMGILNIGKFVHKN